MGTGFIPEIKTAKITKLNTPPCNAEIKNDWSYASSPSIYPHSVEKDEFTFTYTFKDSLRS
jgi:hypothetical protein